jgi:hypothetical protein
VSVDHSAKFTAAVSNLQTLQKSVAAPVDTMFFGDKETVDMSVGTVAAWNGLATTPGLTVGAATYLGVDEDGHPLTAFVAGQLNWRRRKHANRPA